MASIKSAIRTVRDELFLDRSDGNYLSRVGSNLSMDRPQFGFHNDSLWRAVVRRGALDQLQIASLFRDWLDVILGPQITVTSVLSEDTEVNNDFLMVTEPKRLPQRGYVVINEGLTPSKTYKYTFIDPLTGKMEIDGTLVNVFTAALKNATGTLLSTALIGATSLTLRPSEATLFPISGFSYSLLVDAGTKSEEVVQLTAHPSYSAALTVSALTKDHFGPTTSATNSRVDDIRASGTVLVLLDTSSFPNDGLIRIKDPGIAGVSEYLEFYKNDVSLNTLYLRDKVLNTYVIGSASVTLMFPGSTVQIAQLQVKGVGWDIFQTEARKLQIYIPTNLVPDRILDASFIHDDLPIPLSTILAAPTVAGDIFVRVNDAQLFPMSGAIRIDSGGPNDEYIGYSRINRFKTILYGGLVSGTPAASSTLYVEDARTIFAARELTRDIILSRGLGAAETVTWNYINLQDNTISLVSPTVNTHACQASCEVYHPNILWLTRKLANSHLILETVDLIKSIYSGTSIDIGDPTVTPTSMYRYQGHYVYRPGIEARKNSSYETTLAENIAGPVQLVVDQRAGRTSLEVEDATLFDDTGAFSVTIGRYKGSWETVETSGVVRKREVNTAPITLAANINIGDFTFTTSVGGGALLPNPSAGAPYGYRVRIVNEIFVVRSITGDVITLEVPAIQNHFIGDQVKMISDVIMLSDYLAHNHEGKIPDTDRLKLWPGSFRSSTRINLVEELRTHIEVNSLTGFPTVNGKVILNFGKNLTRVASYFAANYPAGTTVISMNGTSSFPLIPPVTDFMVQIGESPNKEWKLVTVNNTALNQLTMPDGLDYAHLDGTWVVYDPGETLELEYASVLTAPNRLVFAEGIYFSCPYMKDVPIVVAAGDSEPIDYGTDYPFILPPSWDEQLKYLFDRGRAAGVEVVIISNK